MNKAMISMSISEIMRNAKHYEYVKARINKILDGLDETKAYQLKTADLRNIHFASCRLNTCDVEFYRHGLYIMLRGTRTTMNMFVKKDGTIGRKPRAKGFKTERYCLGR